MLETIRHAGYSQVAKRNCERGARACIIGTTRSVRSLCRRRRCPAACPCFGCDSCPLNPPQHVGSYFLGPVITAGRPARTADTSMGVPRTRVPYKPGRRRVHPKRFPQYRRRAFGLGGGAWRGAGGDRNPRCCALSNLNIATAELPLQAHAQCTCATPKARRRCSSGSYSLRRPMQRRGP